MKTTEFKDSELGPIPKEWEVRRLGDMGEFKNGISKSAEYFGRGNCFVNLLDVFGKDRITSCNNLGKVEVTSAEVQQCRLRDGDVLFVRSSVKPSGVGLATVVDGDLGDTVFSGFLLRYRATGISPGYMRYILSERQFRARLIAASSVSVNTNINQNALKRLAIPFPPLAEQRRIAEVLGKTDEYIEALKKLIEKRKNVKRGAMQELLSGKRRLPGFEGEWVEKRLGECAKIGNGKDYKQLGSGDIPVYGTGGLMTRVNDFLHDGPTVCFGRKGTIDEPQYHEGKIWTVDTLFYTYDFTDVDVKWLFYRSQLIDWLSYNAASGVPSLTANTIESIKVLMPSLSEQKAIAKVLSEMDEGIEALEKKLKKVEAIKEGMMQDLLTGKVRLK